ncbi:MAG: orotidine-5'-phosphate decarboxylase [Bdellovibrionales bacterium]|nr:orotidine-5'-phosphate decarboxylase [Bdellovibrionales bacterium]
MREPTKRLLKSPAKSGPKKTELIVALDFPEGESALKVMRTCADLPVVWKIGSELFLAEGPDWVRERTKEGFRIFLDLKFHDIPNTVMKSAVQAASLGIEMFTLHLAGGPNMIRAVRDELEKKVTGKKEGKRPSSEARRPLILGVSVLTSFDQPTWDDVSFAVGGKTAKVADSVKRLVSQARYWGVDGVVCSPHEIKTVRAADPLLFTVVPGIRPKGAKAGDQARVMTPKEAATLGAGAIVCGRPVTESKTPKTVIEKILRELDTPVGMPVKES